eukprot:5446288-Prymnesium_polylepis.1
MSLLLTTSLTAGCAETRLLRAMHDYAFGPRPPSPPLPPEALRSLHAVLETARDGDGSEAARSSTGGMGAMYERAATDGELEEEG